MANLIQRLLGRGTRPEQRWGDGGWGAVGLGSSGSSYGTMPARLAESLAAVQGCIGLISSAVGALPASLVSDTPTGQQAAPPTSPAWRAVRRPSEHMSWPAFAQFITGEVLSHGNALAMVRRDNRGAVSGLVAIPWEWATPVVITGGEGPRLAFDLQVCT